MVALKTHYNFYHDYLPSNVRSCSSLFVHACSDEVVSYSEVEHWMWRLFLDDYGEVCQSLGLSHCVPFPSAAQTLPPPTPLLYGISPTLIPRQPYWPQRYSLAYHISNFGSSNDSYIIEACINFILWLKDTL